jgi:hypothetical protein
MKRASSSLLDTAISRSPASCSLIQGTAPIISLSASPSSSAHRPRYFQAWTAKDSSVHPPSYRHQSPTAPPTPSTRSSIFSAATLSTLGTKTTAPSSYGIADISTSKGSSKNSSATRSPSTSHGANTRSPSVPKTSANPASPSSASPPPRPPRALPKPAPSAG